MKSMNFPTKVTMLLAGAFVCFLPLRGITQATPLAIEWQRSFGGANVDEGYAVCQTSDGGYVFAGMTISTSSPDYHGGVDVFISRLDGLGNLMWQRCFGGTGDDYGRSIEQTTEGGFIVAGWTKSNSGQVVGQHGDRDGWVFKLDGLGNLLWQKCIGGSGFDILEGVIQDGPNTYIAVGSCSSGVAGNLNVHQGSLDYLLVKLDLTDPDTIAWLRSYGGASQDMGNTLCKTSDGGYFIGGDAASGNGMVVGNHNGGISADAWVFKTNSSGVIQWKKCLGGSQYERAESVGQTIDGNYVVFGFTTTMNNGDVVGNHGGYDSWVVKLTVTGTVAGVVWSTCVGGAQGDVLTSGFQSTLDGGFFLSAYSLSSSGQVPANYGSHDFYVAKLDSSGTFVWGQNYGGSLGDMPEAIRATSDGGLVVVGRSSSTNGNISVNNGITDVWVVKLMPPISTLPIELLSFDADKIQGKNEVALRWLTASEQNCESFRIVRSIDMSTYEFVGSLPGAGTTASENEYELVDESPVLGTFNYYTLEQKDIGGEWRILETRPVYVGYESQDWDESKPYCVIDLTGRHVFDELTGALPFISSGQYILQQETGATKTVVVLSP